MEPEAGTMGLTFVAFSAMWVAMMAAMMFPSIAPVAILWVKGIARAASGVDRARRIATFVAGYVLAWSCFGAIAFGLLLAVAQTQEALGSGARWVAAVVFAIAGIYQVTPLKDVCLAHCRSPLGQLMHYSGYRGRLRDLKVGLHHGAYCVGCCWALMIVLLAVGVMNVPAMVLLAVVIFLEKLWRFGPLVARVAGGVFIALAVLVTSNPNLAPGITRSPGTHQHHEDMQMEM